MDDWKRRLAALREANNTAAWAIADYIEENPTAVTEALLREADPDGSLPEEALYAAFLATFSGISENDHLVMGYFNDAVKTLHPSDYENNAYLRTIRFPEVATEHWRFTHYAYKPYEAFIRDDIDISRFPRELPRVGYFRERFTYPAVEQDHREWMAVKPSEIATMQPALDIVSGKCVTFGLGLGYFTFMASEKPEVTSIDVVERDSEVIDLFSRHILPQFPNRHKVRIIRSDAFDFLRGEMAQNEYDCAFVDLWHDASDGLSLYIEAKREESVLASKGVRTKFLYWVEESLLSAYRWTKFDEIVNACDTEDEALFRLSDDALRSMLLGGK